MNDTLNPASHALHELFEEDNILLIMIILFLYTQGVEDMMLYLVLVMLIIN